MRAPTKFPREMTQIKSEWNEERLRTHVLMPFLDALGISPASIHVEWQFSLRLGRTLHKIDGEPAQGRADALIKNAEAENLFVVELKRPDLKLKASDGDQGISYARLLDQIAPFVVVSNGNDTHIYDTITKKRLDGTTFHTASEFFSKGCCLINGDDIRIRFEAMNHFVAHSEENVAAFSKGQIEVAIRLLHKRPGGLGKYVPELYVPRDLVRRAFKEFLDHDAQVFALVGESGVGKTNEMCALAESFAATHIVLFFACHSLSQAPEAALSDEFDWSFSQRLETPALCKRLAQMAERQKKPVLIFFDALDEAQTAGFSVAISNFAKHLAPFSPNIRLLISVKRSEWNRFASLRGNSSDLALGMFYTGAKELPNALTWKPGEPVALDQFSENERDAAIGLYEQKFNLITVTQSNSRTLLRHPFFLRVYSETYEGKSEISTAITSDGLIRKWLCKKFEFSEVPDVFWLRIKQIAESIYTKNRNRGNLPQNSDSLESIEVDKLNGLEWSELVTHDILVKSADEENRIAVRFYYSQVLYFLISRHVLQLDKLEAQAFGDQLPILLENYVLQEVLRSHLRSAPASHSRELEKQISGRALTFLTTYSEIFDRLAPALRPSVLPYTHGEMGLAYIAYDPILVYFGFYAVSPENPNYVTRVVADSSPDSAVKALNKLGCAGIRVGGDDFVVSEPRLAAARLACNQIKEVIDRGQLDERQSKTFMVEALLAILGGIEIRRKLRLGYGTYRMSLRQALLPLDLADLSRRIQEYFGVKKYLADWTEEQIRIKSAYVTFLENGHAMDLSGFDASAASIQVKEEVKSGANFASGRYPSEQELTYLLFLIEQLKLQGLACVNSDIYPAPDLPITKTLITPLEAYSNLQLETLIRTFFEESFNGFIALVESNFGQLSSLLDTFGKRPYRIVAGCSREKPPAPECWGWFCWGLGQVDGIATEVRVVLNPNEQFFSRKPDKSLLLGGCDVEYVIIIDIHRLFNPSNAVSFNRVDRDGASNSAPIRAFAYSLLQQDWKGITAERLIELLDKA